MSLRNPAVRRALYSAAEWVGGLALCACVIAAVLTLTGCSVNVIVAPDATLSVGSDLSQNALQELEREYQ